MEAYAGKVMIKEIVDFFELKQLTGNEASLNRWVIVPDVNRPGLELTGYLRHTAPRRIVIMGEKEQSYISHLDEEVQRERFRNLTDGYTPMIILSRNLPCPKMLYEVAQENNFPVFQCGLKTSRLMVDLVVFLDERLGLSDNLHGVLMNIYGKGVLISGESGMGKSEIALELIRRGHLLVADDRVDVRRVHNRIMGSSPDLLMGMLEIRGVGIIDVARMFGAGSVLEKCNVDFVINLVQYDEKTDYNRIGIENEEFFEVLDVQIPELTIPVKSGRSMAVIIEAAAINFTLKQKGYNSAKEFEARVYQFIQNQNSKSGEER